MDIIGSFGRTGDAASDQADLVKKIDDFVVPRISKYADVAYDQVKARLAADMENPEYRAELQKVVDDAKASAQKGVALTVAATIAGTAVLTWALVRYAGGSSKRKDD
jgi:hypothetical protein